MRCADSEGRRVSHQRLPRPSLGRRLALAKIHELRALGWSYREIGRRFSTEPGAEFGEPGAAGYKRSPHRADDLTFLHALDAVGEGLAFFDDAGTLLHTNRSLREALQGAEDGGRLQEEVLAFAHSLGALLRTRRSTTDEPGAAVAELGTWDVHTAAGMYRLRGSYLDLDLFGQGGSILIALEGAASVPTEEALHERFGLSRQERRVALMLAEGRSNAEIASALHISPHTARRHTERVFQKLGARTRAEVGRKLHRR